MARQPIQHSMSADMAVMRRDLDNMARDMGEIKTTIKGQYVSVERFWPVEKIVYGIVGVVLLGVLGVMGTAIVFFIKGGFA